MQLPHCPKCDSTYTYEDSGMYICPECAHEWNPAEATEESDILIVKDANGNLLADGDSVTVVKDLKVKGSSSMLKIGTKVKNIRLVEGDHNIDCKIDGFGPMKLKSEFVKRTDSISGRRHDYFSHNRRRSRYHGGRLSTGASCYFPRRQPLFTLSPAVIFQRPFSPCRLAQSPAGRLRFTGYGH